MSTGGKPRANAIQCSCGYCRIGQANDSTSGIWFVPRYPRQKYYNKRHYLLKMYNGKMPEKKICKCGCNRTFYTIDNSREYIKGHRNQFSCSLCNSEISKEEAFSKNMNGTTFYFCSDCKASMDAQRKSSK